MSKEMRSALGRLWDSLLPGLMCLNPMAMAYYLAVVAEEMSLSGSVDDPDIALASATKRSGAMAMLVTDPGAYRFGPVCQPESRTGEIGA